MTLGTTAGSSLQQGVRTSGALKRLNFITRDQVKADLKNRFPFRIDNDQQLEAAYHSKRRGRRVWYYNYPLNWEVIMLFRTTGILLLGAMAVNTRRTLTPPQVRPIRLISCGYSAWQRGQRLHLPRPLMKRRKPYWIKRFDQRGSGQYCARFYSSSRHLHYEGAICSGYRPISFIALPQTSFATSHKRYR